MIKQALGRQGEELAASYLQAQGYLILTRNYRCREGEIDIICEVGRTLVFVEVKTRRSLTFGSPEEAVTLRKQDTIRRVAMHWLREQQMYRRDLRFDVVSILLTGEEPKLSHIKNAF
ncbi:MAG: YraN family protein [Syntrophomonadaceae bacterium]|nr:YraN family protein [Syntrophomonadaceae bacterium]